MTHFWESRKVFVTGCSGFVGHRLTAHLLKEGAVVTGLVRDFVPQAAFFRMHLDEKITLITGSLEDHLLLERALNEYEIDTVFHLAAQSIVEIANRDPRATFETNMRGTWNLLEACRKNQSSVKRIIVASSDKAYGVQEQLPYTESAPLRGTHPYDVSKTCADLIAYTYFNTYKLPVIIARCGNIYGGGDLNFNRLVPGTIRAVLRGEPFVIRSDGNFKRDYFYVRDAVSAYCILAERSDEMMLAGEAFNFSSGSPTSVRAMVNAVLELMEKKGHPLQILNQSRGEIRDQYLSIDKARQMLDWAPRFSLEDGLRETIEWYRAFLSAP